MKIHFVFCLLMSFGILLSCGREKHAGSTTEATNGLSLVVRGNDGKPLVGARATTFESSTLQRRQTVITDKRGMALFEKDSVPLHLEVLNQDSSSMAWMALPASDTLTMTLTSSAVLTIVADSSDSASSSVLKLEGTPYEAKGVKGIYRFPHLPHGAYLLSYQSMPVAAVNLEAGHDLDTTVNVGHLVSSVMLDDFEDQDHYHLLAQQNGSQGWYFVGKDQTAWILPTGRTDYSQAIEATEQRSSRSLHLQFNIAPGSNFLLMGTYLGADLSHFDLSAMKSIHMRVRGNARFEIAVEQPNELSEGILRKSVWRDSAQMEWQERIFYPQDVILDSTWGQIPFAESADSLALFSIFLRSGTDLWIDDIWFEGVGAEDLR